VAAEGQWGSGENEVIIIRKPCESHNPQSKIQENKNCPYISRKYSFSLESPAHTHTKEKRRGGRKDLWTMTLTAALFRYIVYNRELPEATQRSTQLETDSVNYGTFM